MKIYKHLLRMYALIAFLMVFGFGFAYGQSPAKVQIILVVPPTVHASQDMDFLQKGIVQMLTSRLTQAGKVNAISLDTAGGKLPGDDEAALAQAKKLGADYVVLESLTILGDSVSTDARVLDVTQGKAVLTFGRTGREQADVIGHIDQLANLINTQLLGRSMPPVSRSAQSVSTPSQAGRQDDPVNIYQHPEKLLIQQGADQRAPKAGGATSAQLLMRGRRIDLQLKGVAAGDVDGDGSTDIVCIDSRNVIIYRTVQGQLAKLAQIRGGTSNVGVDTADLNGNRIDEIFVTNYDSTDDQVISYVLEWDGKNFRRIAQNLRWYFRAMDLPERGKVLVGQRRGRDDLFSPGIHEIGFEAGAYDSVQRLKLPRNSNIFGLAWGSVRSADTPDVVAYSKSGYVQILNKNGREDWASSDRYGGSANAMDIESKEDPKDIRDLIYLAPRIHLLDIDGDRIQEMVVVRNEYKGGVFERIRIFKKGRLEILKWDQLGLTPLWRTRDLAKFIADFSLVDMDGDGKPEIVAAVVQKTASSISKGNSFLAVFKIGELSNGSQ